MRVIFVLGKPAAFALPTSGMALAAPKQALKNARRFICRNHIRLGSKPLPSLNMWGLKKGIDALAGPFGRTSALQKVSSTNRPETRLSACVREERAFLTLSGSNIFELH